MESTMNTARWKIVVAALGLLVSSAGPLLAGGGKENVEEGLPVSIESTYPIEYLGREVQFLGRYERTREGEDSFRVEARLELGIWWNTELSIASPFLFGDAHEDGCGPINLEVMYNLNQETLDLPSFSLAAGADFATGNEGDGIDPFVKLLMTRTLGRSWHFHQVHFNLEYQWNGESRDDERSGRYAAAVGYSTRLNADTLFVASFLREQEMEEDVEMNLIEAGLRYQILPQGILSAGLGFGIGDESPDVRFTLGFQYEM
jgi:hypothetical protein